MNILLLNWIYIIMSTFCATAQKISTIMNALQNNYTSNYTYVQENIGTGFDNDSTLTETDFMNNQSKQINETLNNRISIRATYIIWSVVPMITCISICIGIYIIVYKYGRQSPLRTPDAAERTGTATMNNEQQINMLSLEQETFAITQGSSSPRRRGRTNQRSAESQEFHMVRLSCIEEESERETITPDINTEIQQQERSRQQSQSISFMTHAIIDRESISEEEARKNYLREFGTWV